MPDRNTIRRFGERIGADGATALLEAVNEQLHRHGYIARGGDAGHNTQINQLLTTMGKCTGHKWQNEQ